MHYRLLTRPTLLACVLSSLTSGCLSGQTGSPDCPSQQSCLCDPLYASGLLLRVRGEAIDEAGHMVVKVEQSFASPYGPTDIQAGERVGGVRLATTPCVVGEGTGEIAGAELFVLYNPGTAGGYPNCNEFHACAAAQCESLSEPQLTDCWNTCSAETEQICNEHRGAALMDGVFHWMVPWGEQLDFGHDVRLASSEVSVLESAETCLARFPAELSPPCQDTVTLGNCSLTSPQRKLPARGVWSVALALLALAYGARRRRQR